MTTTLVATAPQPALQARATTSSSKGALGAYLLIAIGIALRLFRYFHHHAMWLDESMLSLNLLYPWSHLLHPLDFNQAAPIGFLLLEKATITGLGTSELALRLLPLLAGTATLPVAYLLFRRTLGRAGLLFALALLAFAEEPITYVSQVKQYSLDLFVCAAMLYLAVRFLQTRRGLLFLGVAGTLAIWFSHPAVFLVAAIAMTLLSVAAKPWVARVSDAEPGLALPPVLVLGVVWLVSFIAEYGLILHSISQSAYLHDYWAAEFPPLPVALEALSWYFATFMRIPFDTIHLDNMPEVLLLPFKCLAVLTASMAIDGFLLLRQKNAAPHQGNRIPLATLLGLTFLLLFVASFLRDYPLQGRLLLFAMPVWLVLAGASVDHLFAAKPSAFAYAGRAVACLIVLSTLITTALTLLHPPASPDNRAMVRYLAAHAQAGDKIYALGSSRFPTCFYLATEFPKVAASTVVIAGSVDPWLPEFHDFDDGRHYLETSAGGRVWVLFSELSANHPYLLTQRDRTLKSFSAVAPVLDRQSTAETDMVLFDIR